MEYLGHIITKYGVMAYPKKITIITKWPVPTSLKQLRGFLGLTGYYRKIIKGYALVAQPMTEFLKKNAFSWNSQAQTTFEELKLQMTKAPVLALPDFNKRFLVEMDASMVDIGATLT